MLAMQIIEWGKPTGHAERAVVWHLARRDDAAPTLAAPTTSP